MARNVEISKDTSLVFRSSQSNENEIKASNNYYAVKENSNEKKYAQNVMGSRMELLVGLWAYKDQVLMKNTKSVIRTNIGKALA